MKIDWNPPKDWIRIKTIDAHAEGEPLRIITEGFPRLLPALNPLKISALKLTIFDENQQFLSQKNTFAVPLVLQPHYYQQHIIWHATCLESKRKRKNNKKPRLKADETQKNLKKELQDDRDLRCYCIMDHDRFCMVRVWDNSLYRLLCHRRLVRPKHRCRKNMKKIRSPLFGVRRDHQGKTPLCLNQSF